MIRTPRSEITDELWACPYCQSHQGQRHPDDESPDFNSGCCGESEAHFVKAFIVAGHGDLVLEDEIIIEE